MWDRGKYHATIMCCIVNVLLQHDGHVMNMWWTCDGSCDGHVMITWCKGLRGDFLLTKFPNHWWASSWPVEKTKKAFLLLTQTKNKQKCEMVEIVVNYMSYPRVLGREYSVLFTHRLRVKQIAWYGQWSSVGRPAAGAPWEWGKNPQLWKLSNGVQCRYHLELTRRSTLDHLANRNVDRPVLPVRYEAPVFHGTCGQSEMSIPYTPPSSKVGSW